MWFGLVCLMPELCAPFFSTGVIGRAFGAGRLTVENWNPRDFTDDVHRTVDDRPFGGGPGMLMKVQPLARAIEAAVAGAPTTRDGQPVPVIALSPQGERLTDRVAQELANLPALVLVCGRYEGIDQRVLERHITREISIGDYVISGGELAATVLIDAVARWRPGTLGDHASAGADSLADGLLKGPQYTRPSVLQEATVPAVLMSGDHAAIERWRRQQALGATWLRRPDLLAEAVLDAEQLSMLQSFVQEWFADRNSAT